MSATTARAAGLSAADAGPSTADPGPGAAAITTDVASGEETNRGGQEVHTQSVEQAAEGVAEPKAIDVARPVGGLPLEVDDAAERHKALTLARIRMSRAPAAVKERFAAVAEEAKDAAAVEACLKAVEESLPDFLQEKRGEAARGQHPAGEVFFRGNAEEITDEQAEEMARKQLERSGLLRGQKVRVAD